MTEITSRELNQDLARAKRVARKEPVLVTDRGRPSLVLMDYGEYRRLAGRTSLAAAFSDDRSADVELPIVTWPEKTTRVPDFED